MAKKLPSRIYLDKKHNNYFVVMETDLKHKLGCVDIDNGVISIKKKQPQVGKHLILFHELLHITAEILKEKGLIKRQPDENFIQYAAGVLFPILAMSGLWKGVSEKEVMKFIYEQIKK